MNGYRVSVLGSNFAATSTRIAGEYVSAIGLRWGGGRQGLNVR